MERTIKRLINELEDLLNKHTEDIEAEWYRTSFEENGVRVHLEVRADHVDENRYEYAGEIFKDKLKLHGAFKQASWSER